MKQIHKFCRTCLTKLGEDNYCVKCAYYYGDKPDDIFYKEDFPSKQVRYGLIAALVLGFTSYYIIYTLFGGNMTMKKMGVALFFIVPFFSGATLGYFIEPIKDFFLNAFITVVVAIILAMLIYGSNLAGLLCVSILAGIFIIPLYFGLEFGRFFRRWSLHHLTIQFQSSPLAIFFLMPILYGGVEEHFFEPTPIRTVETQVLIEAPQPEVWKTLRFYEHVEQNPPLILKLGLPIPKRAIGNHKSVGDITSCEYEGGGFITKKITQLIEQEELSFDVIEQSIHFEHDLKLHGGSILLKPVNNGKHTIITMRTHYESYVRPSWLWEPSMDYVIKSLHQYVIKDMQNDLGGYVLEVASTK